MRKIGIVIYPGFQCLGLSVGTVFEYANAASPRPIYDHSLVSIEGGLVATSQGFRVETVALGRQRFDTLIVLGDNDRAPPPDALVAYLRHAAPRTRRMAAVCTGAFVLAAAGVLEGKRATTHWYFARDLGKDYPGTAVQEDRIYVIDGKVWTSAGNTAGIDLALSLVEKDLGPEIAKAIARKLVLYHRRGGGQSQFSVLLELDAKTDRIQTAIAFAKAHLKDELSVDVLADAARLSPRQFSRLFRQETGQSPAKAIERLRAEAARLMLETTRHPVEIVAREAGFGDRERMRNAFLRNFGQPPQAVQRLAKMTALV